MLSMGLIDVLLKVVSILYENIHFVVSFNRDEKEEFIFSKRKK